MNDYNATLLQDEQRYEMKKEFKDRLLETAE